MGRVKPAGRDPCPPPPATIKSFQSSRCLSPPHPPNECPLREPAAERVSGAGGRGRQECRTPKGARRLKLRRWPPAPSPSVSLAPYTQVPPPPSKATRPPKPLHRHSGTSMLRLQSPNSTSAAVGPQEGPLQAPRPQRWGGGGEGREPRGLIHMQGTMRSGSRQERTKAVPPPAAPCQARPSLRPGGPRRYPPPSAPRVGAAQSGLLPGVDSLPQTLHSLPPPAPSGPTALALCLPSL